MKIALFTDTYFPQVNGVATSVKILADHLRLGGHEVIVFAPKISDVKSDKEENVIRIKSVKVFPNIDEIRLPIVLKKSLEEINNFDFDIVHAHGNGLFCLFGYFAARRKGVPFVLTFHTFMTDYAHYIYAPKRIGKGVMVGILKFFASLADSIITPSEKMKKKLVSLGVKKEITTIPNFIEIDRFSAKNTGFVQKFLSLPAKTPVLLFVGRVAKEKNIKFLIDTFSKIHDKNSAVHLAIVGDGPQRKEMEEHARKLHIDAYVHFMGIVKRDLMPKIFASSTMFVFPSTSEVHPMVVLEAADSGLPLVVAADEAFKDLVEDGKNGYVLPVESEQFAQKVLELLEDGAKRKMFGEASRKIVSDNFGEREITARFESIYNELVSGNKNEPFQLVRGSKLRILIATDVFYPTTGGVPVAILALTKGLVARGHELLLMAPSNSPRTYLETFEGIRVRRVGSFPVNSKRSLRLPFNIFEISRTISEFLPDVIHVCTPGIICENAVKVGQKRGIALVGTNHVIEDNLLSPYHLPKALEIAIGNFLFNRILTLYKKLDRVAAPSPFAAKHFIEQGLEDVQPISNGVYLDHYLESSEKEGEKLGKALKLGSKIVVLYVGRLDKEKRVDVLLRAVAEVKSNKFKLVIVGDGVDAVKLKSLAKNLGIESKVSFLGYIVNDHLPNLYRLADIFVMPGDAELQSISTLEAMASGLPVIACDSKALPDLVEHGVNGYLYEKNNYKSCAKYLEELVADGELREKMGKAGLLAVQEHDISKTVEKYEDLYIDAINEKSEKLHLEARLKGFKFSKFLTSFSVAVVVLAILSYYFGFNIPSDIKAAPGIAKSKVIQMRDKSLKTVKSSFDKIGDIKVDLEK